MSRREQLEAFLREHPDNAFALYGLAMDLMGSDEPQAALEQFQKLRDLHPDYAAAYHQEGQLRYRLGQIAEARAVLQAGVAAAQRRGDAHAAGEMNALLDELSPA